MNCDEREIAEDEFSTRLSSNIDNGRFVVKLRQSRAHPIEPYAFEATLALVTNN